MARKAGPGNGAEDAPDGRAGISPEGSGVRPGTPLPEDHEGEAGLRSSDADARDGSLAEDGPGAAVPPPADEAHPPEAFGTSSLPEPPALAPFGEEQGTPPVGPARDSDAPGPEPEASGLVVGDEGAAPDPWQVDSAADRKKSGLEPLAPANSADAAEDRAIRASAGSGPAHAPHPPAASALPRRRGGFGALLLGGMIAAALGFGAAWLAQDRLGLFPARLPADLEERLAALEARPVPDATGAENLADRLAEVEARLTELEASPAPAVDLEPLREEIAQGIAAAEARAAEIEERLAALEARPEAPTGAEAPLGSLAQEAGSALRPAPAIDPEAVRDEVVAALEPRLSDLEAGLEELRASLEPRLSETEAGLEEVRTALSDAQATLDDLGARLDRAEAQSEAAAEEARAAAESLAEAETRAVTAEAQARARAALGATEAALAAGEPFEAPLAELQATGVAVPDGLARLAPEGAPTLAALRESFPEAARAGLAAARDQGLVDSGSGMLSFLRNQLSVRSVAPREGEDPDAVLSRAEAQLAAGQLDAALAEIATLPEPVRAPMADWIAQAEARAEADAALAGLRDSLPDPDASPAD